MPASPSELWSSRTAPNLLTRAASVLARETSRAPGTGAALSGPAFPEIAPAADGGAGPGTPAGDAGTRRCPVTGARVQTAPHEPDRLGRQGRELLATLLGNLAGGYGRTRADAPEPLGPASAGNGPAAALGQEIRRVAEHALPVNGSSLPIVGPDIDLLRRQAHEFIESLLVTFSQATGEKAAPYEDQVPLLRGLAPVRAGGEAAAEMRVANEEATPSGVALYCTDFVADSGYEIPSLRVVILPRSVEIPPHGEASFEVKIAVPQQTPAGTYSGLIQAAGSKYVKAVLSVEVL